MSPPPTQNQALNAIAFLYGAARPESNREKLEAAFRPVSLSTEKGGM